ncbi:MAG: hypothetical protein JO370_03950 [Paucibacter sp.]|nr:hypothetical protein [Roseateles sp.]
MLPTEASLDIRWDEPDEINLDGFRDEINHFCSGHDLPGTSCQRLLNGWNFLDDLAYTLGISDHLSGRDNEQLNAIYQKIFKGCNLPSITSKTYHAVLYADEIRLLQGALIELQSTILEKEPQRF